MARKTGIVKYERKPEKGARLRMRDWKVGLECMAGDLGEPFYDIVIYKTLRYLCLISHTATEALNPQTNVASSPKKYWASAVEWEFIASKLALVERIKAEDIDTNTLVAKNVMTADEGARIEMFGSEMNIFGTVSRNIHFGVNAAGMAVLEYYDNNGRKLYDLGPDGITKIPVSEESWSLVYLKPLGLNISEILGIHDYKAIGYDQSYAVYQYHSKVVAGVVDDPANDNLYFKMQSKDSKIAPGWYAYASSYPGSIKLNMQWFVTTENGRLIYPDGIHADNEPVYARSPVYMCPLILFETGGKITKRQYAFWNGRHNGAEI